MRDSNLGETGRRNRRPDELSPLDKRIIEHLQEDGRRPFTQIASALGVSEAAVRARTNRLVERGILQIVGVADPDKLGFQQALIGVRCQPGKLLEVAEALASMPEVDYVVVTTGRFDVLIETVVGGQRGTAALPGGPPAADRRGAGHGNLLVPAAREADLPVRHQVMPTVSEIALAAIVILVTVAFSILLAPAFAPVRRALRGNDLDVEAKAEGMGEPQGDANDAAGNAASKALVPVVESAEPILTGPLASATADPTLESRVIRIVSWAFLMAVAVFAAGSGLWIDALPAIVIVIAVTGLLMLVIQDMVPRTAVRRIGGPLQGLLALAFVTGLVAMTGGLESPFTFGFPLIVGAGALLVAARTAFALAVLATAAYIGAGLVADPTPEIGPLVQMAVTLTGVFLLAYVGASVGREQRRARDAAIRLSTIDSADRPVQPELLLHRARAGDRAR